MRATTICTSAFPFVPATISLANMTSTYVPADCYARLLTVLGHESLHVTAVDVHSQFVSSDGRTRDGAAAICDAKTIEYRRAFELMDIKLASLPRTDAVAHVTTVREAIRTLLRLGAITQRQITTARCSSCGAVPPVRLMDGFDYERLGLAGESRESDQRRCPYCRGLAFHDVLSEHWFLRIEHMRAMLLIHCDRMLKTPTARPLVRNWLAEPLPDWNISRDNEIGISLGPYLPGKSLYLWFEALLGYWSIAPVNRDMPKRFAHFFGKNILYYHAVVWPLLYALCYSGDPGDISLSARGLVNKQLSDPHLLDLAMATSVYHSDYLRFYMIWIATDSLSDVRLTTRTLIETVNNVLCDNVGNLLRRLGVILQKRSPRSLRVEDGDPIAAMFHRAVVPAIRQAADDLAVSRSLRIVVDYVGELNRHVSTERLYQVDTDAVNGRIAFMIASVLTLLSPFLPRLVEDFNIFVGWEPGVVANIATATLHPLKPLVGTWQKIT
ncbi:MAG TPA: class I tRNA ligase family protein [Woeseiaceae bacterium]